MVRLTLGDSDRTCDQLRQTRVQLIERGQLGRRAAVVEVETNAVVLFLRGKDIVTLEQYGAFYPTHIILLDLHAEVGRGKAHMLATKAQRIGECDIRVQLERNHGRSIADRLAQSRP